MKTGAWWTFSVLVLQALVLLAALAVTRWTPAPPAVPALASAVWLTPEGDETGPVRLPDDWRGRGGGVQEGRYRIGFTLDQPAGESWALLVDSVRMDLQVQLDGEALGAAPALRGWKRPRLVLLPAALLHAGPHSLTLTLRADAPGRGYLGQAWLGPLALLQPAAQQRALWQQTLPGALVLGLAGVGAMMLLLWSQRPHETAYAYYGLGLWSWALHNLDFIVARPPLPQRLWEALAYLTLGGFVVLSTRFIHRVLGWRRPRLERGIALFVLAGVPLFAGLPDPWFRAFGDGPWNVIVLGTGLWLVILVHREAWRRRDAALQVLAASGSVIAVFGAHDLRIALGLAPWGQGYVLQYAAAAVLCAYSGVLVMRFGRSLTAEERMNDELRQRVQEAVAHSEVAQARLQQLERERWLVAERERIAQDMHDGVGGHLVALLARARTGALTAADLEPALAEAMADLHLVIHSLEVPAGDLQTALAGFRHRLERRLAGSGVHLRWSPGELPLLPRCGPGETLQLLRLLDEAASNAIRHAAARTLHVRFGIEQNVVQIEVSDDGQGGALRSGPGHGLRNLHRRADAIGATLKIDSASHGTRLVLTWPLVES
ncbi:ATP-binding protein [Piscinibacter sp.]|uniref:ATP-binding protein n=1 Tax=Piscinibacter sp. TaxID=1903157 RepID=UPI002C217CFE|nr:ATP-binding protein [Albitalea sp.]HUG24766.1 ATP-binding protein [Albitalea sp.]